MSEKIKIIVSGGKASITPQLAQQAGPMGINISKVIIDINEKTASFKGMEVPVTIELNKDKSYSISIGTPAASQLIKTELNLQKGSGIPNKEFVGNLAIEEVVKIARMKSNSLYVNNIKSSINTILGTCCQMGVLVESKNPKIIIQEIKKGVYDNIIDSQDLEVNKEKRERLNQEIEIEKGKFKADIDAIKAKQAKKAEEKGKKEEAGAAKGGKKEEAPTKAKK